MAETVEKDEKRAKKTTLPPVTAGEPGYGLGIAGFVTSFVSGVVGLVLSAVALKQSKAAGRRNSLAFAGFIIGIVRTALGILAIIGLIITFSLVGSYCASNPDGCRDSNGYYNQPNDGGDGSYNQTY